MIQINEPWFLRCEANLAHCLVGNTVNRNSEGEEGDALCVMIDVWGDGAIMVSRVASA